MRQTRSDRTRRQAFTLIELLTVIAIIAVLVALTSAAVMKMWVKGPEAVCRAEMANMSTGIGAFKQEFGVSSIPSQFVFHNRIKQYQADTSPVGVASYKFMQQAFGKRVGYTATGGAVTFAWGAGNGKIAYGDQCLVFFLGGIPTGSGFAADPTNPTAAGGARRGPFYDFKAARLITLTGNSAPLQSYADPFGTGVAYAYFSNYGTINGYGTISGNDCGPQARINPFGTSAVAPYQSSGTAYINPNSFQIISAGPNKKFGPGGVWSAGSGSYVVGGDGDDDLANFSSSKLGASVVMSRQRSHRVLLKQGAVPWRLTK